MNETVLRSTLRRVGALATLPDTALRIMAMAEDPAATERMVHSVLVSDPPLAARVLRVVNSAFYHRQREVSTPLAAIRILGTTAIQHIAMAASLHRLFRGRHTLPGFDPAALWMHSVAVATAARELSIYTRVGMPEEALLAGLLHDIGIIAMMQAWLPAFSVVIQQSLDDEDQALRSIELRTIGVSHDVVGATLCDLWHFPETLTTACRSHHDYRSLAGDLRLWAVLIHTADRLAPKLGGGYKRTVEEMIPLSDSMSELGLTASDIEVISRRIEASLPQMTTLLT